MEGKKIKIGAVGKHDARSNTLVNFDEGTHQGIISQIFLTHGTSGIMSIQFQFLLDGNLVLSDHHGPPHEYITGISGEYYRYEATAPHIRCLKFTTNTSEYGPFGTSNPSNEKFAFKLGKSPQFGGFHGTYDASGLQYIGAYLQPHEYITGISGEYCRYEASAPHIRCLKFTTNTSVYGPFGTSNPSTERFAFKLGKSPQFGGFYGSYNASGLQYIGVYLQPKTVLRVGPIVIEMLLRIDTGVLP